MMKYLFYCYDSSEEASAQCVLDSPYSFKLWRPSPFSVAPSGTALTPFALWWLMHYSGIFKNSDYGLFLVYDGEKLVHRTGIFPGYFRFPFMSNSDLQVGDLWTDPEYRGRHIASFALEQILATESRPVKTKQLWQTRERSSK